MSESPCVHLVSTQFSLNLSWEGDALVHNPTYKALIVLVVHILGRDKKDDCHYNATFLAG